MQKLQRNKQGNFGARRSFRGRTVAADGKPRSHQAKSSTIALAGFTCGDTAERPMQSSNPRLSPYWVPAPRRRWQRRGIVCYADTGEQVR